MGGPEIAAPVELGTWFGTDTATATLGSLAGAKAIIQSLVSGWPNAPDVSAVPVLAATSPRGGKHALVAVPLVTTACISEVTAAAVSGLVAVSHGFGLYVLDQGALRSRGSAA